MDSYFPIIDFRGVELSNPGTESWVSVRSQVMEALDNVGFFTAVFDDAFGEILDNLCGPVAESLFTTVPNSIPENLDMENQLRIPGFDNVFVDDPQNLDSIKALWPQGNPSFCDTFGSYTRQLSELELMVRRMILESLGVAEHYFSSHVDSTRQTCLLAQYLATPDDTDDDLIKFPKHRDTNFMSIIYQHQNEGLELLTKSGKWLRASPYTFTVMTGDSFEVWSNGRIKPSLHHVKLTTNIAKRYSACFGSQFKDGCIIEAPGELVNAQNPKLFNAFEHTSYMLFAFSEQGRKSHDRLRDFCGVKVVEE